MIEGLLGQSGVLKLQRFGIEALERNEDHLLFAAETDDGKLLPAETVQKLMQLPASQCHPQNVFPSPQIENALTTTQHDLIKRVNSRNLAFFEDVRRNAKIAPTLAEKLFMAKAITRARTRTHQQQTAQGTF